MAAVIFTGMERDVVRADEVTGAFLYLASNRVDFDAARTNLRDMAEAYTARKGHAQPFLSVSAWYESSFSLYGTWESWINATVTGRHPTKGGLRFIAYVLTEKTLGKGNASIAQLARKMGRKLYFFDRDTKEFSAVLAIRADDPSDFVGGWSVETGPLGAS